MPVAYAARPHTVLPPHRISTEEILADMAVQLEGHPQLSRFEQIIGSCGVETRHFTRPLNDPVRSAETRIAERNAASYEDSLALAVEAAEGALANAGLEAGDIDAVVTSHTSSWASPGIDVDLLYRLGLPSHVRRTPMSGLACVGGALALSKGAETVANPFVSDVEHVLVVVAETLSTIYDYRNPSIRSTLYNALFGDGAAAVVLSRRRLGPGMAIEHTWEYLLPDSRDHYFGQLTDQRFVFESTPKALRGPGAIMPALHEWLARRTSRYAAGDGGSPSVDGSERPRWVVVHPGGPRILEAVAEGLALDADALAPSWTSLRTCGNLGGVALLHILQLRHDDPPAPGEPGLGLAFGPGFTAAALWGHWA